MESVKSSHSHSYSRSQSQSENSSSISQLKSVGSKTFSEIPGFGGNRLRFPEGDQDFEKAIKICHESMLKYLSYINFCYSTWRSNFMNSIQKKIRGNISSANQVSYTFSKVLKDYEKKAEMAEPVRQLQVGKSTHSKSSQLQQRTGPGHSKQQQQRPPNTEAKLDTQIRERSFNTWLNELRGMRQIVKSIEKDTERYLKYFTNVYILFLANRDFIEDFEVFDEAMKINSRIVISMFERKMTKTIHFHKKTLRDYHHRLNVMESEGYDVGNCNILLNNLEANIPKYAEQFVACLEALIQDCHTQIDEISKNMKKNHAFNDAKKLDELLLSITRVYEKVEDNTKAYFNFLPRSVYRNESDKTIGEYRKSLEIPPVDICLVNEENETEDTNHSNSTSYSMINRTFDVERTYESNKSSIIGNDFQNLLKKGEKYFKTTLQQGSDDTIKNRQRIKKVVDKNHQILISSLNKTEKSEWRNLEINRDRARTFVRYQMDLNLRNGQPKKNLSKYLKEINTRTRCHFEKIKQVSRLIQTFFEKTNREYMEIMKVYISDTSSIHQHKLNICKIFLSQYQLELSTMAEIAHSQLLTLAQDIEMKESLAYAIGEFVRGLKWADHSFMKCLVDCCTDSFNVLWYCYVTPITSMTDLTIIPLEKYKDPAFVRLKSVDASEAIQVVSLYFAGFLKSQSIPEDTNEVLTELLKNISEDASEMTLDQTTYAGMSPSPTNYLFKSNNGTVKNEEQRLLPIINISDKEKRGSKSTRNKSNVLAPKKIVIVEDKGGKEDKGLDLFPSPSSKASISYNAWSSKRNASEVMTTENVTLPVMFCTKDDI